MIYIFLVPRDLESADIISILVLIFSGVLRLLAGEEIVIVGFRRKRYEYHDSLFCDQQKHAFSRVQLCKEHLNNTNNPISIPLTSKFSINQGEEG